LFFIKPEGEQAFGRNIMNEFNILLILMGFGAGFLLAYWVKGKIVSQKIKAAQWKRPGS
jgi:hypothetical protein